MSTNNRNQRNRGGGGGSGGGGGNQQQRRRARGQSRGQQQQAPRGPAMTPLGESTYEAVFDHGNDGYGVWFDGVVRDDPMYKQFWKGIGLRAIFVRFDEDTITITRELGRELADKRAAAMQSEQDSKPASDDNDSSDSSDSNGGEAVYSAEDAARLFAGDAAAPTDGPVEGDGTGVSDDEIATPRRRVRTSRAAAAAESTDADGGDEPAPAKPRRAPRARRVKIDEDEQPAASAGGADVDDA